MGALLARIFNLLRLPGFVRETEYHASIAEVSVQVRTDRQHTVVSVNGVDVYFKRTSGRIEGVGLRQTGHRWGVRSRPTGLAACVWPDAARGR